MNSGIPENLWMHTDKTEQARRLISVATKLYKPLKVWALCSGGNDSLCSTHVAMSTGLCDGVASINTTIGVQQTRDHMQMVADRFGWPLRWLTPPVSYEDICAKYGMPGPGAHPQIYARLKERCVRQLRRDSQKLIYRINKRALIYLTKLTHVLTIWT